MSGLTCYAHPEEAETHWYGFVTVGDIEYSVEAGITALPRRGRPQVRVDVESVRIFDHARKSVVDVELAGVLGERELELIEREVEEEVNP